MGRINRDITKEENKHLIEYSNVTILDFNPIKKGHNLLYLVECNHCKKQFYKAKHTFGLNKCQCYKTTNGASNYQGYKNISAAYFRTCKAHAKSKNREFSITKENMWDQWLKQQGQCSLTGLNLHIERNYTKLKGMTASLDRINSSLGYTVDNIQWIHKDVNRMKSNFDENYFKQICILIAKNNKNE